MKSEHANLQHRPFLIPIWLTAIAAIGAAAIFCFAVFCFWVWFTANSTTVVVIRHAEKETGSVADPALSAAGEARAALLANMFDVKGAGRLDAIYTSAALRNRLTAAPLATRLGIAPIVAPSDDPKGLAHRVLRENSGGRVMIIGHINTVPEIVAALSGRSDIPSMDEKEYGAMYIVTVPRIGDANLLRLNY
jgi:phosphohistidine phosphatase SixA